MAAAGMGVASKQVLRVGVVGAGSIGCLFAARLFAANRVIDNTCPRIAVSLVSGKSGARALFPRDELNQLRVTGLAGGRTHEIPVRRPKPLDDQQVIGNLVVGSSQVEDSSDFISLVPASGLKRGELDVALICVKQGQTLEATQDVVHALRDDSVVISVQNGLEALEKIRTVCQQGSDGSSQDASSHRVSPALVQAVTYVGAKVLSDITPATIECSGPAATYFPTSDAVAFDASQSRAKKSYLQIGNAFARTAVEFGDLVESAEIDTVVWKKLLANAVVNPITALLRQSNGVINSPEVAPLVETVVDEFLAVAHACNISLGFDNGRADALAFIHSVATNTSTNTSSMLADVLNGRETEIEAITGSVVRRARRHGVAVPAHEHLLVLVRALRRHHPGERDAQG